LDIGKYYLKIFGKTLSMKPQIYSRPSRVSIDYYDEELLGAFTYLKIRVLFEEGAVLGWW